MGLPFMNVRMIPFTGNHNASPYCWSSDTSQTCQILPFLILSILTGVYPRDWSHQYWSELLADEDCLTANLIQGKPENSSLDADPSTISQPVSGTKRRFL